MNPKFSIVITTFNRASLLQRALDSLLAQTCKNWEGWVVDDGSTDETRQVITTYLGKGYPLQYIFQENRGEARAKNRGVALSQGEYISFLDSDDEYETRHLESRQHILSENPDIALLHGGVRVVGDPFVPDLYNPGKKIHINECVVGSTFFFRRACVFSLGGFNPMPIGSDVDLFSRTQRAGFSILKTDLPTYIYHRTHLDSITHKFWENIKKE